MKRGWIAVLAIALALPALAQQKLSLKLDGVGAGAKEKVEIDLDEQMLSAATGLAPLASMAGVKPDDPKMKMAQSLLAGVKELAIRHYAFDAAGKWNSEQLEPVRRQLNEASGWKRMVNVKDGAETVEVYLQAVDAKPAGLLLMAGEAKELTVVYVNGAISMDKLKELVDSKIVYNLKDLPGAGKPADAKATEVKAEAR